MRKDRFVPSLVVCLAACLGTTAFAAENWLGKWKLNPAKSQLAANTPRAQTLTFQSTPAGIKVTVTGTDDQGKPWTGGYTSKFDGTDVPSTGSLDVDASAQKKIDDNTYENRWKKGGK